MNATLKQDREKISVILAGVQEIANRYYEQQDKLPPSLLAGPSLDDALPNEGIGALSVLDVFSDRYAGKMANMAGPRFFGFVTGGSTPSAVAGDWLVSVYDQVMSGSNDSVAHLLERQTIKWMLELFGLSEQFTGTFVTGATMSNFVGINVGRQWVGEQYGRDISSEGMSDSVPVLVLSGAPHSSVLKAMSMSGLGRQALQKIDCLPDREAIDVKKLEQRLQELDRPVIVVANAGTVNTVDFDDIRAIADLRRKYPFFLHVDAAFGGFASLSDKFRHLVAGIDLADSVAIDAHKWLNVPYDAAMHFTRHRDLQLKVFQNNASYLGDPSQNPDNLHLTPENSRRFRALPAWFSLMAYGAQGHRDIVERNCEAAALLGKQIESSEHFRLLAPVRMNVVCFTFQTLASMNEVRHFLYAVRDDGRVFFTPTVYRNTPAIRAAMSNWQTSLSDIETGFEALCEVYQKMTVNLNYK